MALYSRIWKAAAGLLGTAGIILALLTEPTLIVLGPLAAAATIAVTLGLGMSVGTGNHIAPMRFLPVFALSFCVVGTLAFLVVGVFSVVAIVALLAATSPYVLGRVCGLGAADSARLPPVARAATMLSAMSTADLAREWRRTYLALSETNDPALKARIVDIRAALLDELERRDSDGIHVWLESGCPVQGDPTQYMESTREPYERDNHGEGGSKAA